jgi:hypothetical protein
MLSVGADTILTGNVFHRYAVLNEKEFLIILVLGLGKVKRKPLALVELRLIDKLILSRLISK